MNVGDHNTYIQVFEEKEQLMKFYEKVLEAKMHVAYFRVVERIQTFQQVLLSDIYIFIEQFNIKLIQIKEMLFENRKH